MTIPRQKHLKANMLYGRNQKRITCALSVTITIFLMAMIKNMIFFSNLPCLHPYTWGGVCGLDDFYSQSSL